MDYAQYSTLEQVQYNKGHIQDHRLFKADNVASCPAPRTSVCSLRSPLNSWVHFRLTNIFKMQIKLLLWDPHLIGKDRRHNCSYRLTYAHTSVQITSMLSFLIIKFLFFCFICIVSFLKCKLFLYLLLIFLPVYNGNWVLQRRFWIHKNV